MTTKDLIKITLNLVIAYIVGGVLLGFVYGKTSPIIFQKNKEEKEAALKQMMPMHLIMNVPEANVPEVKKIVPALGPVASSQAADNQVTLNARVNMYQDTQEKLVKRLKKKYDARDLEEFSGNKVEKTGDWEVHEKHAEYYKVFRDGALEGYIVQTFGKGYSSYINILVALDRDFTVQKISILHHAETPGLGDDITLPWFKDQFRGKDMGHLEVIKGETKDKIQAITGATISSRAVTNAVRDAVSLAEKKFGSGAGAVAEGGSSDGH
jgi:electron transport complex protein RnfG